MHRLRVDECAQQVELPAGLNFDSPSTASVPEIIDALRTWFPNIGVGSASCLLRPSFYRHRVQLADRPEAAARADHFMVLVRDHEQLAAVYCGRLDIATRSATACLAAIAPRYRGMQLGLAALRLAEVAARSAGAELVQFMATLHMPQMQSAAEELGWLLVGIIPGSDIELLPDGHTRRVYEAVYVKVLCAPESLWPVRRGNMTPATLRLYGHLFGEPAD